MRTRTIGSLTVPVVGLGTDNFGGRLDLAGARDVVSAAIDAGATFIDTADAYGATKSEEFIGEALRSKRDKVILTTKFGVANEHAGLEGGAHPDYVRKSLDASLRRLRTDYVDLYQLHYPDENVPIADTLGALQEQIDAGKVREVGCSNFSAAQLREANSVASEQNLPRFVSVQNMYNLLRREAERDVLPTSRRLGIAFVPYYPLLSGILTGKYRKGRPLPAGTRVTGNAVWQPKLTEDVLGAVERLADYAESHGRELLDLAFAWLLADPAIPSVIAGAMTPAQVERNVRAADWELTPSQRREVDQLLTESGFTPEHPPSLET